MEKASWGYEIIANIHEKLHILLSPGVIYPVLYSMEKRGLIKKYEESRKKFYMITKEGLIWLNEMLDASKRIYDVITVFKTREKEKSSENFSTITVPNETRKRGTSLS